MYVATNDEYTSMYDDTRYTFFSLCVFVLYFSYPNERNDETTSWLTIQFRRIARVLDASSSRVHMCLGVSECVYVCI